MKLLTRTSVRYLAQHRIQLGLSILGVALGVAVVLSIDLAIQSSRAAFRVSAETVSGRATHQVTGRTGSIDEDLLLRIRTEFGLRESAPVVEGFGQSTSIPGQALRILGVDPFSEGPFRSFVSGGASGFDVAAFVTTARGVVLSAATADRAGVALGDSLPVVVLGESWSLPVVGVLGTADRLAQAGTGDLLVMDIAAAQDLLRMPGALSRIDLRVPETEGGARALAALAGSLGGDASVTPVGTRAEAMSQMIAAFDVNLTALSLLALIFGMFLIYNAVTFSVVQRRDLLGRLRSMGVTRGEVLRLILTEAVWIGIAGATLGLGAGFVLARGLVRLVTRTINDLYFSVTVEGVTIEPIIVVKAAALGVAATLLASLPPAWEAASAKPRLATLRSVSESRVRRLVPLVALAGSAMAIVGGAVMVVSGRNLAVSFGAFFLIVAGFAAMTPMGTIALVGTVRPLLRAVGGSLGLMASRSITTTLSRTAPAVAALVVAVSVTVGLGVMIQSFRGTLVQWLDGTLQADIYVSLPGPGAPSGTLWPEMIEDFVAHPAVDGYSTYRGIEIAEDGGSFSFVGLNLDPRGEAAFDFVAGDRESIMRAFQAAEGAVVSEPYAFHRDLVVGDSVSVPVESGVERIPILGVFYDYASERGTVMVSRDVYDRLYEDRGVTSLGLFLVPGADSQDVVQELLRSVPTGRTIVAQTNDALRAASIAVFDRTFEVTAVLRLLAFIVAFVGVLSALMALELERARELGLLRASGLTPAQVWKLVATQTGLLGLASGILAIPMGLVLSVVMIFVINKRSFGWSLQMEIGPDVLIQAVALALIGALVAGVYPAWRMSRISPAVALRGE